MGRLYADDGEAQAPLELPRTRPTSSRRRHIALAAGALLATTIAVMNIPCLRSTALMALGLTLNSVLGSPDLSRHPHARPVTNARHQRGAVASESDICSRIGADTLKQGGNAADAMVSTVLCTGVIGMYHSGIGGGGFVLVRGSDGRYEHVDFREAAPAAMNETVFVGNEKGSVITGLASGVPGEIRGLAYIHEKYGVLPWKDLVMPAVKVARYGFPVSEDLVRYMNASLHDGFLDYNFLVDDPNWAIDFAPNGTLLQLGDTITRKRYANTLETIALEGPETFYSGAMARAMITAIRASNGTMTMDDLSSYSVISRNPVSISYRNHTLFSASAPASGAVALSALKILESFPPLSPNAESAHRIAEAFRFAYGQRTSLGDPSYVPHLSTYEASMLNASTAAHLHSLITDNTHNVSYYNPSGLSPSSSHGTSHVVTSDSSGLSLSLTTTINLLFGSKLLVPETGLILNNEMDDFSIPGQARNAFGFPPSPNNYVRPGARPLSSIAPIIVEDSQGRVRLVTGAAGGSRIITASALQALWTIDQGISAGEALKRPRVHDQLMPNVCSLEPGWGADVVEDLTRRGHVVASPGVAGLSAAQSIALDEHGVFEAASEPRQKNSGGYVV